MVLHEVLFGLLGHAGGLLDLGTTGGPDENTVSNAKDEQVLAAGDYVLHRQHQKAKVRTLFVPEVLSQAEARSVEEICEVGRVYSMVDGFVKRERARDAASSSVGESSRPANSTRSLVLKGFCAGVEELLQWHHLVVCGIEQEALEYDNLPLSKVKLMVMESRTVLPVVLSLCEAIEKDGLVGGQILELVYTTLMRSGAESVRRRLEQILFHCNKVFFNMIEAWMVHGLLVDSCNEFFISERQYKVHIPSATLEEDEHLEFYTASSLDSSTQQRHSIIVEYEWKSQFRLSQEMLPHSYFPYELARKVLFVGKAVRVLQRSQHQARSSGTTPSPVEDGTMAEFLKTLARAKREVHLDMSAISKAIRTYYSDVAFQIQKLVVRDAKLVETLQFVREFFLLGRGEFYGSFVDIGRDLLSVPPRPTLSQAETAVNNGPWREAAIHSGSDDWHSFLVQTFTRLKLVLSRPRIDYRNGFRVLATSSFEQQQQQQQQQQTIGKEKKKRNLESPACASNLVMVGESILDRKTQTIQVCHPRGGFWYDSKVYLEKGFTSVLDFMVNRHTTTAVALCMQHDPLVGPTALGNAGCGVSGLLNCISFGVRVFPVSKMIQLYIELSGGYIFESKDALLNAASPLDEDDSNRGMLEPFQLRVEYKLEGEHKVAPVLQMELFDSQNNIIASLRTPLEIYKQIQLEQGSGKAYVGILGGNEDDKHTEKTVESLVRYQSWYFSSELSGEKSEEFDPWRSILSLHFQVKWPLHLILTQSILDQYSMMFQFLLCLKRVEHALKESWATLNQARYKRVGLDPELHRRLMMFWRLRSSMAFLVNNLQFHLQVDVIDSLQQELVQAIHQAKDFAVVEQAHSKFMESLIHRSFLHNKIIRNTFDTVLRRCLRFTALVAKFARYDSLMQMTGHVSEEEWKDLDISLANLSTSFSRDSTFLFSLLTRMNSNLLLRVDYNSHFSRLAKKEIDYKYSNPKK